jgi:hypothetical protein
MLFFDNDGYVIIALACWADARRKFFDTQSDDPARAKIALALIGKLYDIERDVRAQACARTLQRATSGEVVASTQRHRPIDTIVSVSSN